MLILQQADNAWREGIKVLLPELPPDPGLAMSKVQEVLQTIQMP
jgi:hypothetical protein